MVTTSIRKGKGNRVLRGAEKKKHERQQENITAWDPFITFIPYHGVLLRMERLKKINHNHSGQSHSQTASSDNQRLKFRYEFRTHR